MAAVDRFQKGPEGQKLLTSMTDKGITGDTILINNVSDISLSADATSSSLPNAAVSTSSENGNVAHIIRATNAKSMP